jgi:hypothetical protein
MTEAMTDFARKGGETGPGGTTAFAGGRCSGGGQSGGCVPGSLLAEAMAAILAGMEEKATQRECIS